jgi:hypothetical protein
LKFNLSEPIGFVNITGSPHPKKKVDSAVAGTAMGKPPFKASDGGLIDRLRELEEIT